MPNISDIRALLYRNLRRYTPSSVKKAVSISKPLYRIKNILLGPAPREEIIGDYLKFENLDFYFAASNATFQKAKTRGIEARISRLAMSSLLPGSVAFDVGANYGFITMVMGRAVQPGGKVFAFEPVLEAYSVLQSSIMKNDLSSTCQAIQKFVGRTDHPGYTSIDQVIDEYKVERVDFIKIDVDGGDFDVLMGAKNTLKRFHPNIVVEMGKNQQQIFDFLHEIGYKHFSGMENEEVKPPVFPPNLISGISPLQIPQRGSQCSSK